ncbi:MAG TPA: nucleoside deaminase [Clostridiaceae bacterium]|nr:nucleoside deaminase [Clostridiaceae bacterium]
MSGSYEPLPQDNYWMKQAQLLAAHAAAQGEVPIGAIVVRDQAAIGLGWNRRERLQRITEHAELMALKDACDQLHSWRLDGCDLYVTLEPCLMCAGAIQQARIRRLIFGASDPKTGAIHSKWHSYDIDGLNHIVSWTAGVRDEACSQQLKLFFRQLRWENKQKEEILGGRGARRRKAKGQSP